MSVQPSTGQISQGIAVKSSPRIGLYLRRLITWAAVLAICFTFLGASAVDAFLGTRQAIDMATHPWAWNIFSWEVGAIGQKLGEGFSDPAQFYPGEDRPDLVRRYLDMADQTGSLEREIDAIYASHGGQATDESAAHQAKLDALRAEKEALRPAVEVILEAQVGSEVVDEGIDWLGRPFPPVWFTFTEPPKKLVVSPRGRIATAHYAMLQPAVSASDRESIEDGIMQKHDLSAYVTNIGGLGAFPTQVIDRAPLHWVLTTIAHEWVHNYLTLFPLGLHYNLSSDLTIMNETVADIVGDELGLRALNTNYPDEAAAFAAEEAASSDPDAPPPAFDFRSEMRHTREITDQFLALGRIEDAEEYMEIRRLLFVENGYDIRKLNQAYFAFHGSYGTGAAATSPIGPKLEELRSLVPDVRTFLQTVRGFTSPDDIDRALDEWRS